MASVKETFGSRPPEAAAGKESVSGGVEHRKSPRRRVLLTGRLIHSPDALTMECAIQNISRTGARVKLAGLEALQDPIYLVDMRHGLGFKARVRWRREDRVGLRFTEYYDLSKPDPQLPTLVRRIWLDYLR